MALFHLHVTQVKRSAGQSVVTSAAYRAGEKLYSEYYGEVSDYTLAVVQEQAVSAIVVATLPHQFPGRSVLLIGHVRDFGCAHFTRSLCKILKTTDLRF